MIMGGRSCLGLTPRVTEMTARTQSMRWCLFRCSRMNCWGGFAKWGSSRRMLNSGNIISDQWPMAVCSTRDNKSPTVSIHPQQQRGEEEDHLGRQELSAASTKQATLLARDRVHKKGSMQFSCEGQLKLAKSGLQIAGKQLSGMACLTQPDIQQWLAH